MRNGKKCLAFGGGSDSDGRIILGGFLIEEDRKALIALARDGLAAGRVTRRANALVLLDKGMSCQQVAEVLLFDDDTIRGWYELFEQSGVEGLSRFDVGGSSSKMTPLQCGALKAWVGATLPRSTRHIGAWIAKEFGLVYESRSGLIALLHRLGLEYHKPEVISRKLDPKTQKAFIASYEDLLNSKGDDEVAIFVDAVHPTHAARPVGCWAPKEQKLAIEQTSGRERINIHGAIDLETGQTRMIEAETIDAISTIRLLELLELLYPLMVCIHVFLDNARYHHAKLVKEWLAPPSCRIKLHFLPTYCPHLNPIERLWGVMHKNITHNKCYGTCGEFAETTLEFLRDEVPRRWAEFCDLVTDNFRIISPKDFRLLGEQGIHRNCEYSDYVLSRVALGLRLDCGDAGPPWAEALSLLKVTGRLTVLISSPRRARKPRRRRRAPARETETRRRARWRRSLRRRCGNRPAQGPRRPASTATD